MSVSGIILDPNIAVTKGIKKWQRTPPLFFFDKARWGSLLKAQIEWIYNLTNHFCLTLCKIHS